MELLTKALQNLSIRGNKTPTWDEVGCEMLRINDKRKELTSNIKLRTT